MSRRDLRALFRTNSPDLVAENVFADRREEWDAVGRSVARCVERVRGGGFDVEDLENPRRNVLVFYGVGGIGKTTLSQKILEQLTKTDSAPPQWPPLNSELGQVLPVRIDLSSKNGANFETVLLAIRLAVAALGRPMPAFDLAFHRYWQHNHPGEPLEEYLRRNTFLTRLFSSDILKSQIESALSDVAQALLLPGTLGSLTGQGARVLVRALRERRTRVRVLAGCSRLSELLEAEPDAEALSYYPHLLAWDLAQLPPQHAATPVVLLDTFEDVSNRAYRDLERSIQRLVWLMPNALFVITGRDRLQWDDERLAGQLDWVGAHHWPLLAPGAPQDPRQHRVGYLSAHDSQDYLRRRLMVDQRPLMDEATRRLIVERAHGLPLYLDLAVMRFLELYHRGGHAPDVSEFNYDFPALVARTFRDLTPPERHVLRAVSLLESFSVELASAGAGMDLDAPALRLVQRPFIDTDPAAPWPYHLHDLVRSAVREADSTSPDRWSPNDWRRAAQRLLDALGREFSEYSQHQDRKRLLGCLRQGLRLAQDHDLELGWLADAAFAYVQDFVWEPLDIGTSPSPTDASSARQAAIDSPALALAETLTAISRRQRQHRQLTLERLHMVLDTGLLPADLVELPSYFIAECHRDLGELSASMSGMRQVAAMNGRLAADASRGLLHLTRRLGHFPEVLSAAEELGTHGRKHRTLGDLWWTQGRISLACGSYALGRNAALEHNQPGEAALAQACLAFAAALQDRSRAEEEITRAEHMLAGSQARFAELQVANARLLREAGSTPDLPNRAEAVAAQAGDNGLTSSAAYARFAVCFHAAVVASPELVAASRAGLQECLRGEEFAYLLELAYLMLGEEPPPELPRARWIDGPEQTQARWTRLVEERRHELTTR